MAYENYLNEASQRGVYELNYYIYILSEKSLNNLKFKFILLSIVNHLKTVGPWCTYHYKKSKNVLSFNF